MAMQPTKKKRVASLPQDIIELVLVRLPVSNLLRCRVVCKQWDGIIRDPQFTMAHLRHAQPRPLLFFQRGETYGKSFPSEAVLFDEAWLPSTRGVPVIEPDDFMCASCNGLVCLYSDKSTIKIANLATGESMHLAKPVKYKHSMDDHSSFYSFGFSPATNEYKVLHFLPGEERHHVGGSFSVIQVYTLGDEKWRDVRTEQALSLFCVKQTGVVNADGAMYWLTKDEESSWRRAVVSFDLRDERQKLIRLPEVIFADPAFGNPLYRITEIDSKVSVAAVQARRDSGLAGRLHVWTLDNKVKQSWILKHSIELSALYILRPHFIYGDKIAMHSGNDGIYCHELTSQKFTIDVTKLAKLLDFSPRWIGHMQSYMYVKSLVRLDAYKKAGIVCTPRRKEGWRLKKWEAWEHERSEVEELWRAGHGIQQRMHELARMMGVAISLNLPAPPDQQDSPLRRLNWVEQRRVANMLKSHLEGLDAPWAVIAQAADAACGEKKKMTLAADHAKQRKGEESEAGPSRPKRKRKPSSRFDSSTWTT
ncbi:hypothetical protein CFC21_078088 [Triticum aestivum]|uniref:F-box domain-containing protein n=5 Tax=Triticinae TaxID=1648030 RepID=A0A453L2H6_AEGTS|nr:putative F-box only protein 9 [Aegilops tauschii subsp. strangulata]XP_044401445.1 putative F-box only protein 9 isoform X1 [Triticum aestivum]XP_044401446.1 putative F-box only protein 9 isoform X1 [Triticum aestivum]KAF7073040.1 hypothetical protein CFC21_078088 [Triticum aestivum]